VTKGSIAAWDTACRGHGGAAHRTLISLAMPAHLLMIGIDWYGPFSSLRSAKATSVDAGVEQFLYFALTSDGNDLSYIGLSRFVETRFTDSHHTLGGLNDGEIDLWVGTRRNGRESPNARPRF